MSNIEMPSSFETPITTSPTNASTASHTPTLHSSNPPVGNSKRRKMSRSKTSPVLKRASSTPQMSSLSVQETGALSPSALDKRRNKLGYQRISIACAHCRRRKIRCVLSEGDELGRCQNCIRLKKECVFYPVDSTGGTESRAQSKTSLGSKSSSVISNSPTEKTLGSRLDHDHETGRFPPLISNAPSDYTSVDPATGLGISTGTPISASDYSFDPTLGARRGWNSGMYAGDMPGTEPPTPMNWRLQESSHLNEYSAYPTTTTEHSPGLYPSYSFPQHTQPAPLRSMSYGHIEPAIGNFAPQSRTPMDFTRPGSTSHYNLSSLETGAPSTCSVQEPSMTPVATESPMAPFTMYAPQQQWGYYPHQPQMGLDYSRHDSLNTQWYHPPQLGPGMNEQDPQHHQHPMSQPTGSGYAKGP